MGVVVAPAEGTITAWELDEATRSVWLTDGREVVQLSASGWELSRRLLVAGEDVRQISDLAVLAPVDVEAPVVEIISPVSGSMSKTARPRLEIRYRDDRSGVRSGTVRVRVDGSFLATRCWRV